MWRQWLTDIDYLTPKDVAMGRAPMAVPGNLAVIWGNEEGTIIWYTYELLYVEEVSLIFKIALVTNYSYWWTSSMASLDSLLEANIVVELLGKYSTTSLHCTIKARHWRCRNITVITVCAYLTVKRWVVIIVPRVQVIFILCSKMDVLHVLLRCTMDLRM